ncbi:DUF3467 domain-containing protein [Staphylococcus sp. 11007852]|uniref:DUF3467 domain-containing protein n=1 Tax=Staphylococcus sp. 11007852 TaxID=2714543 RepID=UPI001401C0C1|nr:DUF3467 domain-containing protein [Staphylococcus sp. 11007852]NHM75428.1 DUF3467 domain-containing protein [Staphylococcus sp. 11007852]
MGISYNGIDYERNSEQLTGIDPYIFYTNSLEMRTSITDFMINFTQHTPNGFVENKNVMMSPSLAKQLKNALDEAINQYEDIHGEIKDIDTLQKEFDEVIKDDTH